LDRFDTTSLTSGRSEVWDVIEKANYFPFKFWTGYGSNFIYDVYNNVIKNASAGFEYPYRELALHYGILYCLIFYIIIFLIPTIVLIKRKQYLIFLSYMIIFVNINTFNGICNGDNCLLIFTVVMMFINNLSNYDFAKRF